MTKKGIWCNAYEYNTANSNCYVSKLLFNNIIILALLHWNVTEALDELSFVFTYLPSGLNFISLMWRTKRFELIIVLLIKLQISTSPAGKFKILKKITHLIDQLMENLSILKIRVPSLARTKIFPHGESAILVIFTLLSTGNASDLLLLSTH